MHSSTKCDEVCGDGFNMGIKACDDGNTESGGILFTLTILDGCSAKCTIETGANCTGGSLTSPDICKFKSAIKYDLSIVQK